MADTQTCPYCHNQHPIQARFCPKTGQALAEPPAPDGVVCPACGNTNDTAGRFCPECGCQLAPAPGTLVEPVTIPAPTPTISGIERDNWNAPAPGAAETQYAPAGAPYAPPAPRRFPWVWLGVIVGAVAVCCIAAGVGLLVFRDQAAGISFLQPWLPLLPGGAPTAVSGGGTGPLPGQTDLPDPAATPTTLIFTTPSLALKPTITPPAPATATAPVSATPTAQANTPTRTITLTRTATATEISSNPCADGFTSHLAVGIKAMVSLQPDLPNNVRDNPGLTGRVVGVIHPGDTIDIIGGPSCSNRWVWWYIQYDGSKRGWTAEGDGKDYWIVPAAASR
jgi:hypothetical protein